MILSASRRTDIPCYYSEWFMNRIRAGYVLTHNPINHAQLSKIPLSPYTDTVTISFVDMYPKLKTRLIRPITEDEIAELAAFIGKTAKEHGIRAVTCCEKYDLTKYGIERSSCIDRERIENIIGCPLDVKADKNQREGCGCFESIDIGAYNTCLNGCVYCYANDSSATTARRHASHNPESELLIGKVCDGEKMTERKVKSNKQGQIRLF